MFWLNTGIEVVLGTKVKAADVKRKTLLTTTGETITYKILIIATGARVLQLISSCLSAFLLYIFTLDGFTGNLHVCQLKKHLVLVFGLIVSSFTSFVFAETWEKVGVGVLGGRNDALHGKK